MSPSCAQITFSPISFNLAPQNIRLDDVNDEGMGTSTTIGPAVALRCVVTMTSNSMELPDSNTFVGQLLIN